MEEEKTQNNAKGSYGFYLMFAAVFLCAFLWHAFKALGLLASIFPDERTYSVNSRLIPFSEAEIPNYLYYSVYSLVSVFGENFLEGARILNAFFYCVSAAFVYLIARRACSRRLSLFIAGLALFGPISFLTIFFIVEPMYLGAFWAATWLLLRYNGEYNSRFAAMCGAGVAVLSLVKVHGVFLLPALCLFFIAALAGRVSRSGLKQALLNICAACAAFFVVKFGLGYLFGGVAGITLLGSDYSGLVKEGAVEIDPAHFLWGFAYGFAGQIIAICLLYGVPLLLALNAVFQKEEVDGEKRTLKLLCIFTLSVLCAMIGVTSAFSAWLEFTHPSDYFHPSRIQARYYCFLYPAYLLIAGYWWVLYGARGDGFFGKKEKAAACIVLVLAALAAATNYRGYTLDPIDYPELSSLVQTGRLLAYAATEEPWWFLPVALRFGAVALLAAWFWKPRAATKMFLFLFLPLYTVSSILAYQLPLMKTVEYFGDVNVSAIWLRDSLGDERGDVTIIDTTPKVGEILAFYIDEKDVKLYSRYKEGELDPKHIRPGSKWLLVHGALRVPKGLSKYRYNFFEGVDAPPGRIFELHRLADFSYTVDFAAPKISWPLQGIVADDGEIRVVYARNLPKKMRMRLVIGPEDAVRETKYDVRVAGSRRLFTFSGNAEGDGVEVAGGKFGNEIHIRRADGKQDLSGILRLEITPIE